MCGIVGYSGKKDFNSSLVKILMLSNLPRGMDATGIYSPKNGVVKDAVNATSFMATNQHSIKRDKVFIGHLRAKTIGINEAKNAHPFNLSNVVGVHNGTLLLPWELAKRYDVDHSQIQVDSEVLYTIIDTQIGENDNNCEQINVLSGFDGAAALVFYNKIDSLLYVYRNKERPLHFGYINDAMYIASTSESLEIINCTNIEMFTENYLFKILDGTIISKTLYIPRVKPEIKTVTYPATNTHMAASEYVGFWYQPRYSNILAKIREHHWYYCVSTIPTRHGNGSVDPTNVYLLNDEGNRVEHSKHTLQPEGYTLIHVPGTFVAATIKLFIKEKFLMDEGDIMQIIEVEADRNPSGTKNVLVHSFINDKVYTLQSKLIRPITVDEFNAKLIEKEFYHDPAIEKLYKVKPLKIDQPSEETITPPCCDFTIVSTGNKRTSNTEHLIEQDLFYNYLDMLELEIKETKTRMIESLCEAFDVAEMERANVAKSVNETFEELDDMLLNTSCSQEFTNDNVEFCDIVY